MCQKLMWELVPQSTLGEDVGGNLMEIGDCSTALELCIIIFLALAEECGSRVSQCHDRGPLKERKLLKPDRKLTVLELKYIVASRWRRAGACLRFSYLFRL